MAGADDFTVYISGPLQAASDLAQARRFYGVLAKGASRAGASPYLPHLNTDPVKHKTVPNSIVFRQDYKVLKAASAVVADIGKPSSGVGAELGIAYERGIPVFGVHQRSETPSRFIAGMLGEAKMTVIVYDGQDECATLVEQALRELMREGCRSRIPKRSAA